MIQVKSASAYELFVDGVRIGTAGNLATGQFSENFTRSYPLPATFIHDSPSVVAVRATVRGDSVNALSFQSITLSAGDASQLTVLRDHEVLASVELILPYAVMASILGIVGLMQLGFYYFDRSRRDLLWVSAYCVSMAALRLNALSMAAQLELPRVLGEAAYIIGNAFFFDLLFFFLLSSAVAYPGTSGRSTPHHRFSLSCSRFRCFFHLGRRCS